DLAPDHLMDDATALDVLVADDAGTRTCVRVPVLADDAAWTREPAPGFTGFGVRFAGALRPVAYERFLRFDIDWSLGRLRVGPPRSGFEVLGTGLIHGRGDPMGGITGDVAFEPMWGTYPFVHVPLGRVWRFAIGPEAGYEVAASWRHMIHGP